MAIRLKQIIFWRNEKRPFDEVTPQNPKSAYTFDGNYGNPTNLAITPNGIRDGFI